MLVLSRKSRQSVVVGGAGGFDRLLKVTVLGIKGTNVRLGFEVDADVPVHRSEVWEGINAEGQGPFSQPRKSSAEDAPADLEEAAATMESEGGPPC